MVKNCSNCQFSSKYSKPSFLDGKYVGETEHTTCTNENSMRWYREVNNLITCNEWRRNDEEN